ncbi:Protein N-acetyltransferase, RimJ/RimL family [Cohaesibacter sp. ES.047]|uniref:GNAT family N-acetyltransferase n=1 Tax=Cohaesibacter sp. ES.047 TaxID=1798205 RepID=UPI000BB79C76|nr:GNAT family N-acetyltransferase [Cohaesibacter sp. ES.047]SNY90688.1 Protein N-acetyltransferase, RimJ/RimL family [Cohaesibacter sp. ES.047]
MRSPILRSKRLVLRMPQPQDAPALEHYLSAYEVSSYLTEVPHPYPTGSAVDWIERQHKGISGLNLVITLDSRLIGGIGLKPSSQRELGLFAPSIGYWLAPPFWGKGFMQEAARRLLDWYMPLEPTERISAAAYEDNKRSLKVLSGLGFCEVGRGVVYSPVRGIEVPRIEMELTADIYLGQSAAA